MEWNWQKQKFIPPMTQVGKINLLKPGLAAGLIVLALLHATNGFDARADEPAGRPDGRAAQPPIIQQLPPGMLGSWIWDADDL